MLPTLSGLANWYVHRTDGQDGQRIDRPPCCIEALSTCAIQGNVHPYRYRLYVSCSLALCIYIYMGLQLSDDPAYHLPGIGYPSREMTIVFKEGYTSLLYHACMHECTPTLTFPFSFSPSFLLRRKGRSQTQRNEDKYSTLLVSNHIPQHRQGLCTSTSLRLPTAKPRQQTRDITCTSKGKNVRKLSAQIQSSAHSAHPP